MKATRLFNACFIVLLVILGGSVCSHASKNPYISKHGINFSSGNKYISQNDISLSGPVSSLSFSRKYNSQSVENSILGFGWSFSYNETLTIEPELDLAIYRRSDGQEIHFIYNGVDAWINSVGRKATLTENAAGDGYTLTQPIGSTTHFNLEGQLVEKRDINNNSIFLTYIDGKLTTISDGFGRSLSLLYNLENKVSSISTPAGTYHYAYDENENLISTTNPDSHTKTYLYEDPNDIHNLTGIIDETNTRTVTVGYDLMDRVISSSLTNGSEAVTIEYQTGYKRVVTDSLGVQTTYQLEVLHGVATVSSIDGPGCSSCGSDTGSQYTYNFRQQVTTMTDGRGNITAYTYDDKGNKLTETKAVDTVEEYTSTYTYNANNQVETITVPSVANPAQSKVVTMTYDASGNVLSRTENGFSGTNGISRTTTYTYDAYGRVIAMDGPRTDVNDTVTMAYYPNEESQGTNRGFLHTATNAAGHTVTYGNYNGYGQAELITDANGLATSMSYNSQGLVQTRTTGGLTTTYNYDSAGTIQSVILPGSRTITYAYNLDNQVESITDNIGNSIFYEYDSEGRRTGQQIKDPQGTLTAFVNYEFDDNGRLYKTIKPDSSFEELSYDEVGNLATKINESGVSTSYNYDGLNRLTAIDEPENATTTFTYDIHGNQASVTDAEGHTTTFTFDDFGNRLSRTSPDTGLTSYSYDLAGNLTSKTDANDVTASYTYDALNRLTAISYADSSLNVSYTYDEGTNGTGRLTALTDATGTASYNYNQFGSLLEEVRTTEGQNFTISYNYNDNQELTSVTYPSGRTITYIRDGIGRVVTVNSSYQGETTTVSNNISYLPFGPSTSMTLGNGLTINTGYDQQYRLISSLAGTVYNKSYTYLQTGQVASITNGLDATRSQIFTYDDLGRLTAATGSYGNLAYSYDLAGNRLSKTLDEEQVQYTYQQNNNRLDNIIAADVTSYSYDAAGNPESQGDLMFTWTEDNRLAAIDLDTENKGTYGYDARGLRTTKTTEEGTILSIYDSVGNLIAETDDTGAMIREYVYLDSQRLTLFDYTVDPDFVLTVTSSDTSTLENVPAYAFTETDTYAGINTSTGDQGTAMFNREDFTGDIFKFRVDYLGAQFWSETSNIRNTNGTEIVIDVENIETTVLLNGAPQEGVKVYAFTESGTYLGIYGVTDTNGVVSFSLPVGENYQFRADLYGNQYWSTVTTIGGGNASTIETGGGLLSLSILKDVGVPMTALNTYLFSATDTYLGISGTSNAAGTVSYTVPTGSYKVRVDYLGYQFWTDTFIISGDTTEEFIIAHQDIAITVNAVESSSTEPLAGVTCYLFTPTGSYQNLTAQTDINGQTSFSLPEMAYRVRADYLNQQYWSNDVTWQDTGIAIEHGTAIVEVTKIGAPVDNVNVYAFDNEGYFLNMSGTTDVQGKLSFALPVGTYRFRADYQGSQYWGDDLALIAHQDNPVQVSTGGGSAVLTVEEDNGAAIEGIRAYVFSDSGSYLGEYANTDNNGQVGFNLADGTYKFRVDYLGYQYWTDLFTVPVDSELTFQIVHRQVQIDALTDFEGSTAPLEGAGIYLFTPTDSYMNINAVTDSNGQVFFNLPIQSYKVRLDYLGKQYMSEAFADDQRTVVVDHGQALVHLTSAGNPLAGVSVFVFSASDSYLNITGQTGSDGSILFQLPAGLYKFRADYQSSQFWASDEVTAHSVNNIALQTGGGTLAVTVRTDESTVLTGVNCYLFNIGGSYLNQTATTDENGMVSFDVADGSYQVRVDYLGAQYWSDSVGVPGTTSTNVMIEHRDVMVSVVEQWSESSEGLPGIKCYLFTESGSYTGINTTTDENGEAHFSVPYQNYKVRADYLSGQYWSDLFIWQDAVIPVPHGELVLRVFENGVPIDNVPVYLFSNSGSYLGMNAQTDSEGESSFSIPEGGYYARVDLNGEQFWTDLLNVLPYQQNRYEFYLGQDELTLDPTNNPHPVRWDGEPPVYQPILALSASSLTGMLAEITTQIILTDEARAFWYISDHLGTSQLITDDTGSVVWQGDFQPFGKVDVLVNELENYFRFPGQILDPESGLYYNWHRFYDPQTGRYISADPIGLEGGMNLYAYVGGDPVNDFDIWGLITCVNSNNKLCKLTCKIHYDHEEAPKDENLKTTLLVCELAHLFHKRKQDACTDSAWQSYYLLMRPIEKRYKKCLEDCDKYCKKLECVPSH